MYIIPKLPLIQDIESKQVLKKVADARAALAELKGVHAILPNISILLNTLALQEAKDSSAVENIITTHDELYRAELNMNLVKSMAAKEVQRYAKALKEGYEIVKKEKLITNSTILKLHQILEQNDAGYRTLPGTELKNDKTQEIVYTPPQSAIDIKNHMQQLVNYINDDELSTEDFLIKMAVIHHQFESIHPFYDGNGRLGRIINILYLISKDLIDFPSLYLSRYIIQHKADYYRLLQQVRDTGNWDEWLLFMLDAVISVASQSTKLIHEIKKQMQHTKNQLRTRLPKIYSQDLINNLFKHPYTKIDFLQNDLLITRQTASKYLDYIIKAVPGFLVKTKIGKDNFYINQSLIKLIADFDYTL
jgi:Fic family protein